MIQTTSLQEIRNKSEIEIQINKDLEKNCIFVAGENINYKLPQQRINVEERHFVVIP